MMKVALVGCGQIARVHAAALDAVPGAAVCAVVDSDECRTRELSALVGGAAAYGDLGLALERERPDVVHVLTPPATHADLAVQALQAGCHVLVEKPMALTVAEADRMVAAADAAGVTLSTCHNYLYKEAVLRAKQLVDAGAIGTVVNVAGFYGVAGEQQSYLGTGPGSHWAWRLPGGVFTNFLPHLVYLQQAFLGEVSIDGVTVASAPGDPHPAELTALTRGRHATGSITMSTRARPYMKSLEVYGSEGVVRADLVRQTCTVQRQRMVPGAVGKVMFALEQAGQLLVGTTRSTFMVLSGRWGTMPDLHAFIHDFYRSLAAGRPPAVTAADGRAMVDVLEQLLAQAPGLASAAAPALNAGPSGPRSATERALREGGTLPRRVLVTGAGGYLGGRLVAALHRCGVEVVALVRDRARVPFDLEHRARVVVGSLDDSAVLQEAMAGVDVVYHCAAVTTNSAPWTTHEQSNVRATESVLQAATKAGVQRVVHVSSVIVYGLRRPAGGAPVDEAAPHSAAPGRWAYYERSKIAAEQAVARHTEEFGLPVTVVRPGILYGPGRPVKVGLVRLGSLRLSIGAGRNRLPLTHVDNAVDCLLLAGSVTAAAGQTFNVVDDPQVSVRELLAAAGEEDRTRLVPLPPRLLSMAAGVLERRREGAGSAVPPKLSRFVVQTATRDIVYDTSKAHTLLGWEAEVPLVEGHRRSREP